MRQAKNHQGRNGAMNTIIMVIMTLFISASFIMADPCPAGWRGIAPDCVSLASLVTGRGPCSAAISDDFTTVSLSCPCLGDPRDEAYGIGLALFASQPSNAATTITLTPAVTTLQGTSVAAGGTGQWAQIDVTMPLASFRAGCDYASPSDSVDVYRSNIALKLIQTSTNGNVDTLLTVRYRVMMTVNRLVKASSGVYVAQTIDGEDITAVAKSLVGIASWCSNSPVPSACTYKSNVFQAGQIATMQFGLVSSTLPTFIQSGRCLDFAGNQVWSISSGWSRYANGAGAASVSFAVPSMPNCVTFQWVATVPALTASGEFTMQSVTASIAAPRIVQPMAWYSTKTGMMIQAETPTVATNLSFVLTESEETSSSSSTGGSDSSGSLRNTIADAIIACALVTIGATINKLL